MSSTTLMRRELAVVDQASQHNNCATCAKPLDRFFSGHICTGCMRPQPLSPSEDYFSALGLKRRFKQDINEIENRFYGISRVLHPDRYGTANDDKRNLSIQRMGFLNDAYRIIKDPALRREYIISLEGIKVSGDGIPLELAEFWLEIKESNNEEEFIRFENELAFYGKRSRQTIVGLEDEIDSAFERADNKAATDLLKKLALKVQEQNYLDSLARDCERVRAIHVYPDPDKK